LTQGRTGDNIKYTITIYVILKQNATITAIVKDYVKEQLFIHALLSSHNFYDVPNTNMETAHGNDSGCIEHND
jgi:hypothetical protein